MRAHRRLWTSAACPFPGHRLRHCPRSPCTGKFLIEQLWQERARQLGKIKAKMEAGADFFQTQITYMPDELCLELKALKMYLWSFRNDGIFYERAVNRILDDLVAACAPTWMQVVGDFNVRGGIKSVITARAGKRAA